jgi:hypothetical protein
MKTEVMVSVWLVVVVLFAILVAVGLIFILITRPVPSYPSSPTARCGNIVAVPLTGATFRVRNVNTTTQLWWRYENNSVQFVEDSNLATEVTYNKKGQILVGIDGELPVYLESKNGKLIYTSIPGPSTSVWFFQNGIIHDVNDAYVLGVDINARLFLVNRNRSTSTECGFRVVTSS